MRNVFLIEFDMESHYKDSLSTAIVNILLQCGFENSSRRALDELIGMSLSYMKNITLKISDLTNDCNLPESDILIGLGALKLHGHNLDELFDFVQNYNDIFPPPPKTFYGPIPLKNNTVKHNEEKPLEIVSWAPDMAPSLATIGMKLKNRQIVSDPNFDRSNYTALSFNSPPSKNHIDGLNGQSKSLLNSQVNSNGNSITMGCISGSGISKIPKYGSHCSYQLPPEAYPNKYEPPTIDLDSNGAVIGLNGKIGKLPDPYISDSEEQDLLRPRAIVKHPPDSLQSIYSHHQSRLSIGNHQYHTYQQQQLFNGVRFNNSSNNNVTSNNSRYKTVNSRRLHEENYQKRSLLDLSNRDDLKESNIHNNNIIHSNSNGSYSNHSHSNSLESPSPSLSSALQSTITTIGNIVGSGNLGIGSSAAMVITTSSSKSSPVPTKPSERNTISDDMWNAALMAKVEPLTVSIGSGSIGASGAVSRINHELSDSHSNSNNNSISKKQSKKHKRNTSFSNSRPKKIRKIDMEDKMMEIDSHVYHNESTMDSYVSERSVPYSSQSDREPLYNNYDTYRSNNLPEKSPSYSPANNNFVPANNMYYHTEILPPITIPTANKSSSKSKKKSSRKTHFTNKRKKKSLYSTGVNNNFYSINHQLDNRSIRMEMNDNISISQRSMSMNYDRSVTPSPHPPLDFEDSDDDRTEPMQESSEELIKMLEITDSSDQKPSKSMNIIDPPPHQQVLNNNQCLHTNNVIEDTPSLGGIRMKIKIRKNKNSVTRGPSSIVNSNTDLSSPIQSQLSDDKNSISERLQLMHSHSPLSEVDERICHQQSSFDKSSNHSNYDVHHTSPCYSSTQESFPDFYRPDHSIVSGAVSSTFSKPSTPNKHTVKSSNVNISRFNSSSTHSSLKTLPALDDCDKIPTLLFKSNKSAKKRKRSRLSSGSKKVKSKKSVKLKLNHEETIHSKPVEKHFVSVDDVFSDEDDNIKIDQNHYLSKPVPHQTNSQRPITQQIPPIVENKSPYRMPIPSMKISSKSSSKKSSKSSKTSTKTNVPSTPSIKTAVEPKVIYTYCCLQGEANYKSEDGKTVYTCPICNTEDNGTLMLGCDRCLDWYHGLCVSIFNPPPEDQDWFCPRCEQDKLFETLSMTTGATSKSKSSKARNKKK